MPLRPLVKTRVALGPRAPITEALIDLQLAPDTDVALEAMKRFAEPFPGRWPDAKAQVEWSGQLHLAPTGEETRFTTARQALRGYVFASPERQQVVQVRRDGFTFSKLPPYETWEMLRDDARVAWDRYVELVRPRAVQRVAVRYINRIVLPGGELDLSDWFRVGAQFPAVLGPLSATLVRVVLHHPDDPSILALTTLGSGAVKPDETEFTLDIDVQVHGERTVDGAVWDLLEDLRTYKNDVFFGALTRHAIERLQA